MHGNNTRKLPYLKLAKLSCHFFVVVVISYVFSSKNRKANRFCWGRGEVSTSGRETVGGKGVGG
jgi:hypothetical protein